MTVTPASALCAVQNLKVGILKAVHYGNLIVLKSYQSRFCLFFFWVFFGFFFFFFFFFFFGFFFWFFFFFFFFYNFFSFSSLLHVILLKLFLFWRAEKGAYIPLDSIPWEQAQFINFHAELELEVSCFLSYRQQCQLRASWSSPPPSLITLIKVISLLNINKTSS